MGPYSVHLCQHLWWEEDRQDFTTCHAGDLTVRGMLEGDSTLCRLARRFLPEDISENLDGIPR